MEVKSEDLKLDGSPKSSLPVPVDLPEDLDELMKKFAVNELIQILGLLFKEFEVSSKDLCSLRLVSKTWKRAASMVIQDKNWKTRKFLKLSWRDMLKFEKYFNVISSSDSDDNDLLFSCFDLDDWFTCRSTKRDQLIATFFQIHLQHVKSLIFSFIMSRDQLEAILKSQSSSLKELQIFINSCSEETDESLESVQVHDFELSSLEYLCFTEQRAFAPGPCMARVVPPPFMAAQHQLDILESVLSKIPKDKNIKICLTDWHYVGEFAKKTIEMLQKYEQIKNLKVLSICTLIEGALQTLSETGVRLELFDVDPSPFYRLIHEQSEDDDDDDEDEDVGLLVEEIDYNLKLTQEIFAFICTQADNLESLCWGSKCNFKFPERMPLLKKLRLRIERYPNGILKYYRIGTEYEWAESCLPILYKQTFPKLEEFEIRLHNQYQSLSAGEFIFQFFSPQYPCTSLRKLRIRYRGMDVEVLEAIARTFPCITSLGIWGFKFADLASGRIEREFFTALWNLNLAPTLEELTIEFLCQGYARTYQEHSFDSLFSGLEESEIALAECNGSYQNCQNTQLIPASTPSILKFTSLKKLTIFGTNGLGNFTDFSIYKIFGRMENLKFLHLDKSYRKFSEQAIEHLKNKLAVDSGDSTGYTDTGESRIEEVFKTGFFSTGVGSLQTLMNLDCVTSKSDLEDNYHQYSLADEDDRD